MKKIYCYIAMVLMAFGLASCNGDYEQPPVILPEGGIGTGAWNNPMTAYQASLGSVNEDIATPWVTGYIVGWINIDISNVMKEETAYTSVPATVNTNILIATTPDEKNWENMVPVQLPSGKVRSALNLKDHPENLGVQVTLKGTTGSKYCGAYGVRSVTDFNFGPEGKDDGSDKPVEPVNPGEAAASLYCNFDQYDDIANYVKQGWTNKVVSGGLSGWFIKNFNNNNYASVNALKGTATGGPYEEWLISPAIDIDKSPKKTLVFECQSAYPAPDCTLEVYVLASNTSVEGTRLNANIPTPPASGYSSWTKSEIDLSSYSGTIYIGWKYYSKGGGSDASSTYCIDNVNIGGASEGSNPPGGDNPVTPPASGSVIYEGLQASASEATGWNYEDVNLPSGLTYVWNWRDYNGSHYLNGSAFANGTAFAAESYAVSPVISLEGYKSVTAEFEHAAKFQTTLTSMCGFCVREEGSTTWTEVKIPSWPAAGSWTFSSSGTLDLSAFAGKKVQVAFKYASSASGADTWEIKNLKVSGAK